MKTIVFIHGMFQNNKSWLNWIRYFEQWGYRCLAPAWPDHEGVPAELRANPPRRLGDLRLGQVMHEMETMINELPQKPIVVGHSVGGLIVQLLANKDLIELGVPISSVAPNRMLSMDWEFFKNSVKIANPFKGDEPFFMTSKVFQEAFANTLTTAAAKEAFERFVVHDSRNVLRDCLRAPGQVDLDIPHAPLLFIAGEKDRFIPDKLVAKNARAYKNENSTAEYKEFHHRSHYICNEPGWEEVAQFVAEWIDRKWEGSSEPVGRMSEGY